MYTVRQVARLAGTSVRTLHHYDEIGLLKPARMRANGYRSYGRAELERLQQIMLYRALGVPLAEIGRILDDPGFDRLTALKEQRVRLAEAAEHTAAMIATIDRTIEELQGGTSVSDKDLYSGIVAPEKQAEYERWLEERYGPGMRERIEASRNAAPKSGSQEMAAAMQELKDIDDRLVESMRSGVAPADARNAPALEAHRAWIARMWGRPCPPDAYAGMADMYLAHPDFAARFEAIAPGFTHYLTTAMKAWAERQAA